MAKRPEDDGSSASAHSNLPRLRLGKIEITARAHAEVSRFAIAKALQRHQAGDWGDLDEREKNCNEQALRSGGWILSAFRDLDPSVRFLVITDPERQVTTVMIPTELSE